MTVNSTTQTMNEATMDDNSDVYENVTEDMSFDNLDDESTPNPDGSTGDDDWGDEEEETPAPRKAKEEKEVGEELKLLNDHDGDEKEVKEEEEVKEIQEEEEPAELTEEEKVEAASTEASKKLRIKIGEDHFSLDSGAKLKVKIDGQNEEVSVQDLINNYSGKTAWDKKFTEIGNEKKVLQQEKQQLTNDKETIKAKLAPIFEALKDPTKDPFEALELLVDMTGQDSYAFYKRSLEARLDELVNLSNMSDVEQEAYFLKKQNERLLKSNEKRSQSDREAQQSNQLRSHVDQLRQAYGVSVDQYSEAFDELKTLIPNQAFKHEDVVDWASLKPITSKVEKLLAPYVDEINDSDYSGVVTSLSRSLRDKKLTEQQIQKLVKDEYGISAPVKELNTKLNIGKNKTPPQKIPQTVSESSDSFDDFDW